MTDNGHTWVSVSEAVRLTGKSERTIRRWMTGGKVPTRDTLAGMEVGLAGNLVNHDRRTPATPDMPDLAVRVAELEASVRHCQALLEQVTGERDYLRSALAASLTTTQKLLPARAGQPPWWRFWRRDMASGQ